MARWFVASTTLLLLFCCQICFCDSLVRHHSLFATDNFYFGVNMGGGSTEWKYLVDTTDPNGGGTTLATPTAVSEGGPSWGVVIGYSITKNFAIEWQYMRFANSTIHFDPGSAYVDQNNNNILSIVSKTDAFSLSGKFLVPFGSSIHLRAFAAVGAGLVRRQDPLVDFQVYNNPPPYSNYTGKDKTDFCVTPYMSAGVVYNFVRHWMLESGFQYYTGFGKSELDPVANFIPFAWDAYARLAYQL